jgi:Xaa-Pro aminopeptidase
MAGYSKSDELNAELFQSVGEHTAGETDTQKPALCKMERNIQHTVAKSNHLRIRSVKSEELDLIQHNTTLPKDSKKSSVFCETNVMEYEIEAEFIHEFMQNHSKVPRQLLVQTMLMYYL